MRAYPRKDPLFLLMIRRASPGENPMFDPLLSTSTLFLRFTLETRARGVRELSGDVDLIFWILGGVAL